MRAPLLLSAGLAALFVAGCDGCRGARPPRFDGSPPREASTAPTLDATTDVREDAEVTAPVDVQPDGPAHPMLEALREAFVRAGFDRFQMESIDLRGTAHVSERRMTYLAVDRAVRKLLPDLIWHHSDAMGGLDVTIRTERLTTLDPLRDPRGFPAVRGRLAFIERELFRLPRVEGECGGEGCPEQRNFPLSQCLDHTHSRVVDLVRRFEAIERPVLPDAGSLTDVPVESLDAGEPPLDAFVARLPDVAYLNAMQGVDADGFTLWPADVVAPTDLAESDAAVVSPYLPVLEQVALVAGDTSQSSRSDPLGCERQPMIPVIDYLRLVVSDARATPRTPARRPRR